MKTLALILAGGKGTRLDILSGHRAKPSVPFAGKYRLIDFTLSNCVNSGIYNIGILTQYLPLALNTHIGIGRPWDLDRKIGGITLLQPYTGEKNNWYQGTAHAVYQNINYIKKKDPDYTIILSGDHVYKMDYSKLISFHQEQGADLTIAAQRVPEQDASRFGILKPDSTMKILDFKEKPQNPPSNLASMGIYVFSTKALVKKLEKICDQKHSDFGHHIIPEMIEEDQVYAYEFEGFWRDVGTLESFWKTNLDLIKTELEIDLYDQEWKIYTRDREEPPVNFGEQGIATESLVSNGAVINGKVENSVISPGVIIEEGAVVKDSIIFHNTKIQKNTVINKSIIDKNVTVGPDAQVGFGDDLTPNQEKPDILRHGLNIIAKGIQIPPEIKIERNCRILSKIKLNDLKENIISSGTTIK
ncbi:glucose-1-phosphate adenylyltransferase [Natroniella sulfidigena]|uniref:glucose-1-phosphate adenylyltransferase n=1 Tax=Natroniella sulfidigena TaxID=723921 RepID=UPI00200B5BC1|nr:glucose-1-phosphate adenylyltransferase [Natroniella sulfidigena]MCK8817311.1 glucose-1-phosphate adenylyltransferase [Natroniella sulfidigena]